MITKSEDIENIPDPGRTIEGLRDTGYTFETAVADLIDNSIAAEARTIDIRVKIDFRGSIIVSVGDNGIGMDRQDLVAAMRYGSPRRPNPASLGKFGLGLKTASTAFCRRLSVVSRASVDVAALMATWDLDHVVSKKQWLLLLTREADDKAIDHLEEIAPSSSGTVVLWEKIDRLIREYKNPGGVHAKNALQKHCDRLKDHIAMTYQRFLDNWDNRASNIHINVNGESISPWDPFQVKYSELLADETYGVQTRGQRIDADFTIRAFCLPRREEFPNKVLAKSAKLSSSRQGLYIYREQRLIYSSDWLGMFHKEPHSTLLRVEFSFDHRLDYAFGLDIKKSQITLNDSIWTAIRDQFLPAPRREANRRYRLGRNKNIKDKAKGAHDASNQAIATKEAEIGGPTVKIENAKTGEVTVANNQGVFKTNLKIGSATKPGEVFIQPADDVTDGLLFEPAIISQHKSVRINTSHPYYHKVYVPNFNRSVTMQGMDSLLWALCVAELSATSDKTMEAFSDMRYEMTRILRKLVENLPEPDTGEDEDAV